MDEYIKKGDAIEAVSHDGQVFKSVLAIEHIPSADVVEVRHGRWEHDGSEWKYRFLCSECGYKLMDVPTNYCPHCGARMDGEEQEHE